MPRNIQYQKAANDLAKLWLEGFTIDFNLRNDVIGPLEQFEVKAIYKYEGYNDRTGEIIVYAIESSTGLRGTFIAGYKSSPKDPISQIIKLKIQINIHGNSNWN